MNPMKYGRKFFTIHSGIVAILLVVTGAKLGVDTGVCIAAITIIGGLAGAYQAANVARAKLVGKVPEIETK